MPSFRQANFSGGEISPALTGRNDLEKYAVSLKTCRNMIPTAQGSCLNRPGTLYCGNVATHSKRVRLIPFIYSDDDTYILEFGDEYLRIWKAGVLQAATITGSIPYTEDELHCIKFAQVGDVLWLTHRSYPPATLTRFSDTAWTYAAVSFAPYSAYFGGGRPGVYDYGANDGDHPAIEWLWKLTAVVQDVATGRIYETNPYTIAHYYNPAGTPPAWQDMPIGERWAVYPDRAVILKWSDVIGGTLQPTGYSTYRILSWRVYRGRGRIYGLVGEAGPENTTHEFVDVGDEPDYTQQPPEGRNPFEIYNSANSLVRTEYPSTIAFFEQRLAYGGTVYRPGWVWLSALNSYTSFDKHAQVLEDDAVEFELASLRREEVRSMVGLDKLFQFTSGGVWTLAGVGGPLTAYSIQVIKQTDDGATWLSPVVVRDALLYVRSKGVGVNLLDFEQERDKYSVVDVTQMAKHFFDGLMITDWAYAHDPFNVVWAVRSDGALLSLTFNRSLGVFGWALHETDGVVENVCSVPEGTEDAVYFVVRRTVNGYTRRYIERLASRAVSEVADSFFVDGGVTYPDSPGVSYNSTTGIFSGLSHLEAKSVYAVVDGAAFGPLPVSGGRIILPAPISVTKATIGIPYTSRFQMLDLSSAREDIRGLQKQVTTATVDVESSSGLFIGQTFDDMVEWRSRSVSDNYGVVPLQTRQAKLAITGTWNTGGSVCIEMRSPLPLNITGVSREVATGGT